MTCSMRVLLLLAALAVTAPAFAATAEPPAPPAAVTPPVPVQDAKKALPDKPFIYDANRRPLPEKPAPKKAAGPGIG